MQVEIAPAPAGDKPILQRMMQLYQYDFSEFDGADLDAHGCYRYDYLDHYWVEKGRFPFIIRVDGQLAGFVLVNEHTHVAGNERSIAEFFVMRKYRRQGVGKRAALAVFDRLPGKWEVQQMSTNRPAQEFWRSTIGAYTGGRFTETVLDTDEWKGPVHYFDNSQAYLTPLPDSG